MRLVICLTVASWTMLLGACSPTVSVDVYHHYPASPPPNAPAPDLRFAQIYFETQPSLAYIRLISDGQSNDINRVLGTTPLTIRLDNGTREPLSINVCGRTILVLFERDGYRSQPQAKRISCFSTHAASERNPNEVRVPLIAVSPN